MSAAKPSVYNYVDYRLFLSETVQYLREKGEYSIRNFAKLAKFRSSSYMKAIMDGKRNLSSKSRGGLIHALRLSKSEAEFFEALVQFNQANTKEEREKSFRQLLNVKGLNKARRLQIREYSFYSDWRQVALYTAIGSSWGSTHIEKICQALGFSKEGADRALESLLELGLIERVRGKLKQKDAAVQTASETHSSLVRSFHREMISKALTLVDSSDPSRRSLSSLTLCLSRSEYLFIVKRIDQLRRELTTRFADSKAATAVYQVNFQSFPLLEFQSRD